MSDRRLCCRADSFTRPTCKFTGSWFYSRYSLLKLKFCRSRIWKDFERVRRSSCSFVPWNWCRKFISLWPGYLRLEICSRNPWRCFACLLFSGRFAYWRPESAIRSYRLYCFIDCGLPGPALALWAPFDLSSHRSWTWHAPILFFCWLFSGSITKFLKIELRCQLFVDFVQKKC